MVGAAEREEGERQGKGGPVLGEVLPDQIVSIPTGTPTGQGGTLTFQMCWTLAQAALGRAQV